MPWAKGITCTIHEPYTHITTHPDHVTLFPKPIPAVEPHLHRDLTPFECPHASRDLYLQYRAMRTNKPQTCSYTNYFPSTDVPSKTFERKLAYLTEWSRSCNPKCRISGDPSCRASWNPHSMQRGLVSLKSSIFCKRTDMRKCHTD